MSLEFTEVWWWEEKNKTGHSGSVGQTFPGSPGGFHVLPNVKNRTNSAIPAATKAELSYLGYCSQLEPNLQSYGSYEGFFGRKTLLLSTHLDPTYWTAPTLASIFKVQILMKIMP